MKKTIALASISLIILPISIAYAAAGDQAAFSFVPLNGKQGENEVKMVVNTDSALINHLIFDIVDSARSTFFDITGSNDPLIFPLTGQNVLGTETPFTTTSGDYGYDLASANPANTGSYSALHFATIIADKNLSSGAGGTLSFDSDTAIYVSGTRKGTYGADYTVLPNQPPTITSPKINNQTLQAGSIAPSALDNSPDGFLSNISVTPTFTFSVSDETDASVIRQLKLYKRLNNGSWNYPSSPTFTKTYARSGNTMTFGYTLSAGEALEYSTYYKLQYLATDDQGASDTETFYFSTTADDISPSQVPKAKMTFLSDSDRRTDIISQISFKTSTDNSSVENYYLWTKSYFVSKNILDQDGERSLSLDTNFDGIVSDTEFNNALRELAHSDKFLKKISSTIANTSPLIRLSGEEVDSYDDNGTASDTSDDFYYVPESLATDIIYIVAADGALTTNGTLTENFSPLQIVFKEGDFFGAEKQIFTDAGLVSFVTGDGSLDVWDSIYIYRNAIGRASEFPVLVPDVMRDTTYDYPTNISRNGTITDNSTPTYSITSY